MVVPPKHPKMIIFSRETMENPLLLGTSILGNPHIERFLDGYHKWKSWFCLGKELLVDPRTFGTCFFIGDWQLVDVTIHGEFLQMVVI